MRVRALDEVTAAGDLPWFSPGIARARDVMAGATPFIDAGQPMMLARAPGRLDVMGGIADYSGSLVLEMPLACATFAVAQRQDARRVDVLSIRGGQAYTFAIDLDRIVGGDLSTPSALAGFFAERAEDRWASYVVGSVYRCLTEASLDRPGHGIRLFITSDVPEGKGVSSSAALEVAVMSATAACFGVAMEGAVLATACQWVENHIASAPCGIMDQMTSTLGRRDRLLRLTCQPAIVEGHVSIPAGYRFYGIDSGIRHAVTGADYGTVRTAAFMGYRMIADWAGLPISMNDGRITIRDEQWGGYLANVGTEQLGSRFADRLPRQMTGAEFLARYGGITDVVTQVDAQRSYPVRAATFHPVFEHERVTWFAKMLEAEPREEVLLGMGELMFESHGSYSMCGLGSDGTDWLVSRVGDSDPASTGLYGAKITGGGSGGTVAILGTDAAASAVHDLARAYERETGRSAFVFDGSGPGAEELGVVVIPSALSS